MHEVAIVSAVRTPIANFGGELTNISAAQLGETAARAAIERAGITDGAAAIVLMRADVAQSQGIQPLGIIKGFASGGVAPERRNIHGGAVALGHPTGCTGARILVTLLHAMQQRDAEIGLATLCISGGLGLSILVER